MLSLVRAAFGDMAQRILTINKRRQRRWFREFLARAPLPDEVRILDFGCGTGLFAPVFTATGHHYVGYDVAPPLLDYARWLYPSGYFTLSREEVRARRPFELVVANCCFHHIPDDEAPNELGFLEEILANDGTLLFIDILKVVDDQSTLHRLFMRLEQGQHLRTAEGNRAMVGQVFATQRESIEPSYGFDVPLQSNPIGNSLIILECCKKPKETDG